MELKTIYLMCMCLSALTLLDALAAEYAILRQYRCWSFQHVQAIKALRYFSEVGLVFWAGAVVTALVQGTDLYLLIVQVAIAFLLVACSEDRNDKTGMKRFVAMLKDRSARLEFAAYLTTLWLVPHCLFTDEWALWPLVVTLVVALAALLISHTRSAQELAQWSALN